MLVRNAVVDDARVLREARALRGAGHDITIIGVAERGLPQRASLDGVEIIRIRPVPFVPVVPPSSRANGSQIADTLRSRKRSAFVYGVRDAIVTRAFLRAAARHPADVYHAHDLNTLEAAVRAAERNRGRVVYDAHELYSEIPGLTDAERARWRGLEARLIGRADVVLTVSPSLAAELAARYGIAEPAVVMNVGERPSTVDPSRSPLAALRRDDEMLVLYSGGLTANRGLETLADAAARARGWRLVVMGWGPLATIMRARAPGTAFVDPVAPDEVVSAASAADVGVIPYVPVGRNNELSLPNKLFEYVGAGLAVVASDLVELRRFLSDTGAGVVVEPGNPVTLSAALDALAGDRERLEVMKAASRVAASRHTWDRERDVLLGLYEGLRARITSV